MARGQVQEDWARSKGHSVAFFNSLAVRCACRKRLQC